MAKPLALLFGIVFLLVGILGFVPAVTSNEMLLGIFHVNTAHNIVHLASGIVFLLCGLAGDGASCVLSNLRNCVCARRDPGLLLWRSGALGADLKQPSRHMTACCACGSYASDGLRLV
jgi:Domain of unknown function (DUF4383)